MQKLVKCTCTTLKIGMSVGMITMSISVSEELGWSCSNCRKTWNIFWATLTGGMFKVPQPRAGNAMLFRSFWMAWLRHSFTNFSSIYNTWWVYIETSTGHKLTLRFTCTYLILKQQKEWVLNNWMIDNPIRSNQRFYWHVSLEVPPDNGPSWPLVHVYWASSPGLHDTQTDSPNWILEWPPLLPESSPLDDSCGADPECLGLPF